MLSRRHIWIGISGAVVIALVGASAARAWMTARRTEEVARAITRGDPSRAPELIRRYGCAGCHTISGIPGGDGQVGGSLSGILRRVFVGGGINTAPEKL